MSTEQVDRHGAMAALTVAICLAAGVASALAAESTSRSSVRLKVGETRSLGTYGGHSGDCMRSIPPEIRIVRPPALGTISEQGNVPYVARKSLSGTCLGSQFVGTAVLYTATAPGSETMAFDAAFANGTAHHTVSITVR